MGQWDVITNLNKLVDVDYYKRAWQTHLLQWCNGGFRGSRGGFSDDKVDGGSPRLIDLWWWILRWYNDRWWRRQEAVAVESSCTTDFWPSSVGIVQWRWWLTAAELDLGLFSKARSIYCMRWIDLRWWWSAGWRSGRWPNPTVVLLRRWFFRQFFGNEGILWWWLSDGFC